MLRVGIWTVSQTSTLGIGCHRVNYILGINHTRNGGFNNDEALRLVPVGAHRSGTKQGSFGGINGHCQGSGGSVVTDPLEAWQLTDPPGLDE